MISAPVGFQCPECVNANPSRIINAQSTWGLAGLPLITKAIIYVCLGLFVASYVVPAFDNQNLGMAPFLVATGQWWRLITATFMHSGVFHVGFNMYALYFLGPGLERFFGQRRYVALYALSAFGGSVSSLMFSPVNTLSVGASGAIFGLMTATIVVGRAVKQDVSQIMGLFAINIALGFFSSGIDWRAHLGGAAVGALVAWIMLNSVKQRKPNLEFAGLALLALGLVMAVVYRDHQIIQYLSSHPLG